MAKGGTIRGLERGLQALQALQANPISSLHDIHRITGISKPSLLRILHTLEQFGMVSRRLADGHYRISANLSLLARKSDRHDRIAEAAAPVLDRLCQKISWPSDLLVPAGDHMEIRESSRVRTPFSIYFTHDRIGTPVNWVLSAVGRAYLAYCPEHERQKILALLRKSKLPENRLAHDIKRLDRIFAETRSNGFGERDPSFGGGPYGRNMPDGLAGIAVPLLDRRRVHGVINIVWVRAALTVEHMVRAHLTDLQAAAVEIVNSLRENTHKHS
ncbi:MAG: helix-turn-helix domain-containing protein [Alphaproteobacteria bacterium]|nr:helix-turn-helix domain-containing protein [Alphaproteobacteria bacterium]